MTDSLKLETALTLMEMAVPLLDDDEVSGDRRQCCFDLLTCVYNLLLNVAQDVPILPECAEMIAHMTSAESLDRIFTPVAGRGVMQ